MLKVTIGICCAILGYVIKSYFTRYYNNPFFPIELNYHPVNHPRPLSPTEFIYDQSVNLPGPLNMITPESDDSKTFSDYLSEMEEVATIMETEYSGNSEGRLHGHWVTRSNGS